MGWDQLHRSPPGVRCIRPRRQEDTRGALLAVQLHEAQGRRGSGKIQLPILCPEAI